MRAVRALVHCPQRSRNLIMRDEKTLRMTLDYCKQSGQTDEDECAAYLGANESSVSCGDAGVNAVVAARTLQSESAASCSSAQPPLPNFGESALDFPVQEQDSYHSLLQAVRALEIELFNDAVDAILSEESSAGTEESSSCVEESRSDASDFDDWSSGNCVPHSFPEPWGRLCQREYVSETIVVARRR